MQRVISFGDYIFPDTQDQFSTNFQNTVPRPVRLPNLSGAFDELGVEPAPTETGNIKLSYQLIAINRQQITEMRDAVSALAGWGLRKLVMQPANQSLPQRYTYARLQNDPMAENAKTRDLIQRVSIDWMVPYPRWMQDVATGTPWGTAPWGGFAWGGNWPSYSVGSAATSGDVWGGKAWGSLVWGRNQEIELSLTNNGNAVSLIRLLFTCSDAASSGITIERIEKGIAKETISYTGSIAAGQILDLNCRALRVTLDGTAAYNNLTYTHPAWLRLMPGTNTLRVTLHSGGGKLKFIYPHTWY